MSVEFFIKEPKDIATLVRAIHIFADNPVYTKITERNIVRRVTNEDGTEHVEELYTGERVGAEIMPQKPDKMFGYSHGYFIADFWYQMTNHALQNGTIPTMGPVQEIVYQAMLNEEMSKK